MCVLGDCVRVICEMDFRFDVCFVCVCVCVFANRIEWKCCVVLGYGIDPNPKHIF